MVRARWDKLRERRARWRENLTYGRPVAPPSKLGTLARWVVALLCIDIVLAAVAALAAAQIATGSITATTRDVYETAVVLIGLFYVVTGVVFIMWLRDADRNARAFVDRGLLRHSSHTVIWSWFVPIANWILPKRIVNDIWLASERAVMRIPWFVNLWWAAWIISDILFNPLRIDGNDVPQSFVPGAITRIVAGVLAVPVVRGLTRRQLDILATTDRPTRAEELRAQIGDGKKHPEWKSLTTPANVLEILFVLWIVVQFAAIVSDIRALVLLSGTVSETAAEDARSRLESIATGQVTFLGVTGIAFIVWFRRAYRNLPALGARRIRTRPGWAVGAWFVPLLSLVRPKQMTDDIWRASYPDAPRTFEWAWHEVPVDRVIHIWWGAWVAAGILGQVVATLPVASQGDAQRTVALQLASDVTLLAATVLAMLVVRKITHRVESRGAFLATQDASSSESPPPPPPATHPVPDTGST